MGRRIILAIILPCLLIALMLSFAGVQEIGLGDGYKYWLQSVNARYNGWTFQIPSIPKINQLSQYEETRAIVHRVITTPVVTGGFGERWKGLFGWFQTLVNFLINVVNALITVLNVLITIINVLIDVIKFIIALIWGIKDLPYFMRTYNAPSDNMWWYRNIETILAEIQAGTYY